MKKQGKVLREPRTGPGLLMIEGQQYWFHPDLVWRSDVPPKAGLGVIVELDDSERIFSITTAAEPQLIHQQTHRSLGMAKGAMVKILRKIVAQCRNHNP